MYLLKCSGHHKLHQHEVADRQYFKYLAELEQHQKVMFPCMRGVSIKSKNCVEKHCSDRNVWIMDLDCNIT